jgi:hypothetical protein
VSPIWALTIAGLQLQGVGEAGVTLCQLFAAGIECGCERAISAFHATAPEEIAASPAFVPLNVDHGSRTPTPSANGSCKRVVVYVTSATLLKRAKFPFNSAIFGYSATRAPKLSH